MIQDVIEYTTEEGGTLKPWPLLKHIKPTNPFLITHKPAETVIWYDGYYRCSIRFHSLVLSDRTRWDSINGFNKAKQLPAASMNQNQHE